MSTSPEDPLQKYLRLGEAASLALRNNEPCQAQFEAKDAYARELLAGPSPPYLVLMEALLEGDIAAWEHPVLPLFWMEVGGVWSNLRKLTGKAVHWNRLREGLCTAYDLGKEDDEVTEDDFPEQHRATFRWIAERRIQWIQDNGLKYTIVMDDDY